MSETGDISLTRLSYGFARQYGVLVTQQDGMPVLIRKEETTLEALIEARRAVDRPVPVKKVGTADFESLLAKTYAHGDLAETAETAMGGPEDLNALADNLPRTSDLLDSEDDAPVIRLINGILQEAIRTRASDIHIEPDSNVLRLRQRIDGVLHETLLNEVNIASALVLRLKLMANLDISEKRLPQDGRFNIRAKGQSVDIRMSTMPVQHGESVVMRLLNQSAGLRKLEASGIPSDLLVRLRQQLRRPHGMILVTGPTGSGKTTTLYGALSELNEPGKKIITAEDPVEYRLPRVNQVQVNPKINLDFSTILRTFLRQDPDIILIGEMRDHETVEIGLRAALTGHLVLSTLHTNDAVDSALRMMDMGAPGYLVASAVRAVVAQRLVRKVCTDCIVEDELDEPRKQWLSVRFPNQVGMPFVKGRGCQNCNLTGYRGRIGVFEMLELEQNMMDALRANDAVGFAQTARQSENYKPLLASAMELALQGVVSLDEIMYLGEGDASGATDPIYL